MRRGAVIGGGATSIGPHLGDIDLDVSEETRFQNAVFRDGGSFQRGAAYPNLGDANCLVILPLALNHCVTASGTFVDCQVRISARQWAFRGHWAEAVDHFLCGVL